MLTPVVLALVAFPAENVALARGLSVPHSGIVRSYQAVTDTYIEAAHPDTNYGGDMSLFGGPGRAILIRFGDLGRIVPPGKRVESAELVLAQSGGNDANLTSCGTLAMPWGEGAWQSLAQRMRRNSERANPGFKEPPAPKGSATWRERKAGVGANWAAAGATGSDVRPVGGAKGERRESNYAISGLGPTVQSMVEHPYANHGFALTFDRPIEFSSSENITQRPTLVLTLVDAPVPSGADLSVTVIERSTVSGAAPKPGEEVTYTARVKNVGTAPSSAYSTVWYVADRPGATVEGNKPLSPGEEATFTTRRAFPATNADDHRFATLGFRVAPAAAESNPRNDALEVVEDGIWVDLTVSAPVAQMLSASPSARGSKALEDEVQSQSSVLNEVYFDRSRYSFAPEGVKERLNIGRIQVAESSPTPSSVAGGVPVLFGTQTDADGLARSLARAAGAPNLSVNVAPAEELKAPGVPPDHFAGLGRFGDTRYDGNFPSFTVLPHTPVANPIFDVIPLEASGLLSATEVRVMNGRMAGAISAGAWPPVPSQIVASVADLSGAPLGNLELNVFQASEAGAIQTPAFTVVTGANGTVLLPNRGESGPWGKLDATGANHALLVRAVRNGVTDWTYLKAWQAMDAASRNPSAVVMELRFNLPSAAIETGTNLAKDRIVTDSVGSTPAQLAALIDEKNETSVPVDGKPQSWIEIDLGRDRTVGEVALTVPTGEFWKKFALLTYATGQKAADAQPFVREVDFPWTASLRGETSGGTTTVRYRAPARRFRYLRIVSNSPGAGKLSEVRVLPTAAAPQ